jgi:hypothetical protein
MAQSNFTVEVSGTSGSHSGRWPEGECFMILPDGEHRAAEALARIRLVKPGEPLEPDRAATFGPPVPTTVAEVEKRTEILAAKREVHPVLVLHDPEQRVMCSVHPENPAGGEPRRFTVLDGGDDVLCHITRGRSQRSWRRYWRIDPADARQPLIGHKGTWPGWLGFTLLLPLWCVFFVVSLLITLVTLGNTAELVVWGCPRRVVWRPKGSLRNALDFRYPRSDYAWHEDRLDRRIAFAQAALCQFATYRTP